MYHKPIIKLVILIGFFTVHTSWGADQSTPVTLKGFGGLSLSQHIDSPHIGLTSSPSIFSSNLVHNVSGNRLLFLSAQSTWLQNLLLQNTALDHGDSPKTKPDVIYVPTPHKVVEKMLELAEVSENDMLYDLGCGDGRIVVAAAKKYGCKAVGFDIDPKRIQEAQENVKENQVENLVEIKQKDIFELDLSQANVITLYLLETLNVKLIPQLNKMKPGSRIVSHQFAMGDVEPDKQITVYDNENDTTGHNVFLWTTPLKIEK